MTNLTEANQWETGIRRVDTTDPVLGGESGPINAGIKQLANRSLFLQQHAAREAALNTWRPVTNPKTTQLNAIAVHVEIGMMAVGAVDAGDAYIVVSKDHGTTWAEARHPKNLALRGIGANSGDYFTYPPIMIAVGDPDADAYILRYVGSTGAFTEVANPKAFRLNAVCCVDPVNQIWVAVGVADGTDAYMLRSTNGGTSWTEIANPLNIALNAIAVGAGRVIAVGATTGSKPYMIYSDDLGLTWTQVTTGIPFGTSFLNGICYGNGQWLATGEHIISSAAGTSWANLFGTGNETCCAYSDGVFLSGSDNNFRALFSTYPNLAVSTYRRRLNTGSATNTFRPSTFGICKDLLGGFVAVGLGKQDAGFTLVPGTNIWRSLALPYEPTL